jgi:hypothetical protein
VAFGIGECGRNDSLPRSKLDLDGRHRLAVAIKGCNLDGYAGSSLRRKNPGPQQKN